MANSLDPIIREVPWETVIPSPFAVSRIHELSRGGDALDVTLNRAHQIVDYTFNRAQISNKIEAKLKRLHAPDPSICNAIQIGRAHV